jgi:hypothetical protein
MPMHMLGAAPHPGCAGKTALREAIYSSFISTRSRAAAVVAKAL